MSLPIVRPKDLLTEMTLLPSRDFIKSYILLQQLFDVEVEVAEIAGSNPVAPGSSDTIFIEPPDAETEWMIIAVENFENNNIDASDSLKIYFIDQLTAKVFDLQLPETRGTVLGTQLWPNNRTASIVTFANIIAKRRANQEPWKRVAAFLSTTATLGNRNHVARVLYFPRNRLRI
jgi:hypothetical protein